jgi:hypothetical protein
MSDYKYHSALRFGDSVLEDDLEPMDRCEVEGCVGVQNDLIKNGLPSEMDRCDVIYGECPWPEGFKVFDERAGTGGRKYNVFKFAVRAMIESEKRPIYLICGQELLSSLPSPVDVQPVRLNKNWVQFAYWNDTCDDSRKTSNLGLTSYLGTRYSCLGDFCCGYGMPLFHFLKGGGESFVGADHNGKCIRVMERLMKEQIPVIKRDEKS